MSYYTSTELMTNSFRFMVHYGTLSTSVKGCIHVNLHLIYCKLLFLAIPWCPVCCNQGTQNNIHFSQKKIVKDLLPVRKAERAQAAIKRILFLKQVTSSPPTSTLPTSKHGKIWITFSSSRSIHSVSSDGYLSSVLREDRPYLAVTFHFRGPRWQVWRNNKK